MTGWRGHFRTAGAALALGGLAAGGLAAGVLVLTAVAGAAPAVTAWLTKLAIDDLTGAGVTDTQRVVMLASAAAGIAGVGVVLGYAAGFLTLRMQNAITLYVQERLYDRVNKFIGLRQFEDPRFADQLRLAEDAAKDAPGVLAQFLITTVRSTVAVAGFIAVLLAIWAPMALLLLAVAGVALAAQLSLARRQADIAQATMATQRRQFMYQHLLTDLRAAKETRLFGLGNLFQGRMLHALRHTTDAELGVQRRSTVIQSALAALGALVAALGSAVVVYRAAKGQLTAGDLILFVAATAAVQGAVFGVISQLQVAVSSTRLFTNYLEVMNASPDLTDGSATPGPLRQGIELRDVWFRYDPGGPWILRGLDLTIQAGQAIGLVGVNGAGKSTLVKLLCRFYDVERGQITWDGTDIRQFSVDELRRRIGVTFQDFQTYDLTAAENIGIGDLEHLTDRQRVRRAAEMAGIDEAVSALPAGYDTLLSRIFFDDGTGDTGVQLSGGQNQRLALARTLMRSDADLLILDEPSSGLDAAAEHELHETMRQHRSNRTSLLISHRLGALRNAGTIAVLDDGVIAELGSHDELMAHDGIYATLFSLQAADYQDHRVGAAEVFEEFTISVPIGGSMP